VHRLISGRHTAVGKSAIGPPGWLEKGSSASFGFWRRATNAQHAAEEQSQIAESRRLAAESTSVLTKYPQRSLLLAVEAVKVR
jgi:hypothetical protein